jgi:uncharacterized protein (TIGR03437 family)
MFLEILMKLSSCVLCLLGVAPSLFAAPTITSVANAASNNTINAPVAQGSVFVIKGSGLGPANIAVSSAPFQNTNLNSTSVAVTVAGTTVNALMYYTSDGQVAALLPSNTPTGTGSFTVMYNGQTSNPASHGIAGSNFGILTLDSSGQGPAIVTFPDFSLVSAAKAANCGGPLTACGSANPGDTLTVWGTGVGPVNGNDASGAGLGQNMPDIPLTVWLGGVKADVAYQGRSGCCVGEDQIVFKVPDNPPTGCAVPLVVQIGTNANTVSNTAVLPVAKGSRNCTASNPSLITAEQAAMAGPVSFASLSLNKRFNGSGNGYQDIAHFQFQRITGYNTGTQPFFVSYLDDPPPGTCVVYNSLNPGQNLPASGISDLNAGSSFTIKGPNGSVTIPGSPGDSRTTMNSSGAFLGPGTYTVTGAGGPDIGSFNASLTLPQPAVLSSPQNGPNFSVNRANGLTVTWTGGDANSTVTILVQSAIDQSLNTGATVGCVVAANAGTFTIPPYVLLRLPSGPFASFEFMPYGVRSTFTASGIGLGIIDSSNDGTGFNGFSLN